MKSNRKRYGASSSRTRVVLAVAVTAAAGLVSTPLDAHGQRSVFTYGQGQRGAPSFAWDTLWVYGGPGNDALGDVSSLVPDDQGGVFFADRFNFQVHHVNAAGELVWTWGREGGGPGELRSVHVMGLDETGELVLIDDRNRRITTLSSDGQLIGEVPIGPEVGSVHGMAILESGVLAVHTTGPSSWLLIDRSGQLITTVHDPKELEGLPTNYIYGPMARWKGERWVFGLNMGNGWFTFRSEHPELSSPYVENTAPLELVGPRRSMAGPDTEYSAMSLSTRGDTLAVFFVGTTGGQLQILDQYDLSSGGYLGTHVLPTRATSAVMDAHGRVFMNVFVNADADHIYPKLLALRSRPKPKGPQEGRREE